MRIDEIFGKAVWVCAGRYAAMDPSIEDAGGTPNFPILRREFTIGKVKKAVLRVIGLGFFRCFINGAPVSGDLFLPLSTDFEPRPRPVDEMVTGHRMYVPEYDITSMLREGSNVIAVYFGGGWYCDEREGYGTAKAIYRVCVESDDGYREFVSSSDDKITSGPVKTCSMPSFETRDDRGFDPACLSVGFDASNWQNAMEALPPDTDYMFTDCPADRVECSRGIVCVHTNESEGVKTYDCGMNISGRPVLSVDIPEGETIEVLFSEELLPGGTLDMKFNQRQRFTYVSAGRPTVIRPEFTWFAFRYFSVKGNAVPLNVEVVRMAADVTGTFKCENDTLNWLYEAYLNTQLNNLHSGIPSDCPHLERRGYTGDGELTCHAAMDMLDAQSFYLKWIGDISDCQDIYSGHVQYTAPYTHCGGGPGAWGCAIVEVPWQYYLHYGDIGPAAKLYPQMLRYFDYLEAHSENGLVTSDKAGEWCLGDWCTADPVVIPAPFVNNYYYVKSLGRAIEIARLIGRECDIPMLEKRMDERKRAAKAAYFNTWDGNFVGCQQGANAFAVDMGIGDERTYPNLVKRYTALGHYDTGICGTEVLTRVLFEHGDARLAVRLMASDDPVSFGGMRAAGATTLWEYWPRSYRDRSHDHPMFGAVAAFLFDHLLGIRQENGKTRYRDIVIEPVFSPIAGSVSGSMAICGGKAEISYIPEGGIVKARIKLPGGITALFRHCDTEIPLKAGLNEFTVKI